MSLVVNPQDQTILWINPSNPPLMEVAIASDEAGGTEVCTTQKSWTLVVGPGALKAWNLQMVVAAQIDQEGAVVISIGQKIDCASLLQFYK